MDKKPFKYRCRICGHEWASDSGVYQFCPNFVKGEECVTLCTAYDFPRHEKVDVIKTRPDNHNFEEKYRGDPLGWKRAGYVNRSADWNPKTKRYEWGGDPRKALTKKGRERPTRKDLNL